MVQCELPVAQLVGRGPAFTGALWRLTLHLGEPGSAHTDAHLEVKWTLGLTLKGGARTLRQ